MTSKQLRTLCEGAILVAAAMALSYLKIPIGLSFGGWGGSIDFVMVPLILFAVLRGTGWGLGAGLLFGTLKFFFAGGIAVNWQSMLLDYSLAYCCVGFAGLCRRKGTAASPFFGELPLGALVGCLGRFIIHFISGVTIYAEYIEPIFGRDIQNVWLYSLLYNGSYMLPNTVIAILVCLLLKKPFEKLRAARTSAA